MISLRNLIKVTVLFAFLLTTTSVFAKRADHKIPSQAYLFPDNTYLVDNMRIDKRTGFAVAFYGVTSLRYSGTPEQIARQYLLENKDIFGMVDNLSDIKLIEVKKSKIGYHVGFRQFYYDIPVLRSEMVITINKENKVIFVVNHHKPGISISTEPLIVKNKALYQRFSQ